jgi:hypothetical protein
MISKPGPIKSPPIKYATAHGKEQVAISATPMELLIALIG